MHEETSVQELDGLNITCKEKLARRGVSAKRTFRISRETKAISFSVKLCALAASVSVPPSMNSITSQISSCTLCLQLDIVSTVCEQTERGGGGGGVRCVVFYNVGMLAQLQSADFCLIPTWPH